MPTIRKVQREPIQQVPLRNIAQFSVEQYHAMIDAGVFDVDRNYELMNGWIVKKMTSDSAALFGLSLVGTSLSAP